MSPHIHAQVNKNADRFVARGSRRQQSKIEATGDERVFFALSLDMICVAGEDGYFRTLNPAWTNTLGWSLRHLQSKPFIDFVHPEDCDATLAVFNSLKQGNDTICFENRYRCRNGAYRWLQWNATWKPDDGLVYAIARDVTESKRLQQQVLDISERESRLFGSDIHDGLCQHLAGVSALGIALAKKLAFAGAQGSAEASEIAVLLEQAVQQARQIARGLNPLQLDNQNFLDAMSQLADEYHIKSGLPCTCQGDRSVNPTDPSMAMHLYRIARESVVNAIKHGQATRIGIRVRAVGSDGLLTVEDDGVGFATRQENPTGMGLHLIRYRAEIIRARLTIKRRPGGGTIVQCRFKTRPSQVAP